MTTVIEAEGLTKRFGATQALAGVDLSADRGQVLALLGPNGAGKTTIVRILATLLTAGRRAGPGRRLRRDDRRGAGAPADRAHRAVRLGGRRADRHREPDHDLPAARPRPGGGAGPARARCWSGSTSPTPAGRAVKTYSGGMRRRLDLAASLLGEPEVLFLDEPTTGLDPRGAQPDVGDDPRRGRGRRHGAAHHPVPGGGRRARRPDRGDRPRPGRGGRHARGAEGQDRQPDPRGAGRRPGAAPAQVADRRWPRSPGRGPSPGGHRPGHRGGHRPGAWCRRWSGGWTTPASWRPS